jgi:hypothetical protein
VLSCLAYLRNFAFKTSLFRTERFNSSFTAHCFFISQIPVLVVYGCLVRIFDLVVRVEFKSLWFSCSALCLLVRRAGCDGLRFSQVVEIRAVSYFYVDVSTLHFRGGFCEIF